MACGFVPFRNNFRKNCSCCSHSTVILFSCIVSFSLKIQQLQSATIFLCTDFPPFLPESNPFGRKEEHSTVSILASLRRQIEFSVRGNARSRNWVAIATDITLISIGLPYTRVRHFFNPFSGSSTTTTQVAPLSSSPPRSVGKLSNFCHYL